MAERSLTYVNRFTTPRFTLAHNFQERTVITRTVAGGARRVFAKTAGDHARSGARSPYRSHRPALARVSSENCIAHHSMEH